MGTHNINKCVLIGLWDLGIVFEMVVGHPSGQIGIFDDAVEPLQVRDLLDISNI